MALINCPQCGHKVMSVASTCPKCGFSLSEQRKKDAHFSKTVQCKNCRREIAPGSRICPHCGDVRPVRRYKPWPMLTVLGLAIVTVASLILWSGRQEGSQPEEPRQVAQAQPTPPDTPETDSTTSDSTESEPTAADSIPVATPIVAAPAIDSADTTATVMKWTADWANVRSGRGMLDSIVHILRPGQPVQVADLEDSWWAVFQDGRRIGFVSRTLILDQPPQLEPDTARAELRLP